MRTVDKLRQGLEQRKSCQPIVDRLSRFLISKGVCRSLANEIAQEYFLDLGRGTDLQACLMKRLKTAIPPVPPFTLTLIGPTGTGKSITLLKLASQFISQDLKVVIIDLDNNPKLKMVAQSWHIPYSQTFCIQETYDVCLVDTPGCNYYQPKRIEDLGQLIQEIGPSHTLLTLSANTKEIDLYGAIHQFSCLEPSGLIFTKLDETLSTGFLLTLCQKVNYPLWYVAYGYPLPGKIEVADPKLIANKIITEMNCEEFCKLRQLIIE